MNAIERKKWTNSKRRIERRLNRDAAISGESPMFAAQNIRYEIGTRTQAVPCGGIGAIHRMARHIGLIEAIDSRLHLLTYHLPYHESDHVLNITYNLLCGGECLEDIELRRNDEVFLNALGTERIPDPTTAGDFCRRFEPEDVLALQDAIDEARQRVWKQQPSQFFEQATIDMDGTLVPTQGECKEGVDISYNGIWGYHPLVLTLAETGEVLTLLNRPGNRPSHEGAAEAAGDALRLCFGAGFRRVLLRGDTDFTQTKHLDDWTDDPRVQFIFGINVMANLTAIAEKLPVESWSRLHRRVKRQRTSAERKRPRKLKRDIVREREFETIRLKHEEIAECEYRPSACKKTYRLVIVKKNLSVERGESVLFEDIRYFMYLTNDRSSSAEQIVFMANDRCDQENVLGELKNSVTGLRAPVDNLVSNWAYMVMGCLAWNLKAWWSLLIPVRPGRWAERHRSEKAKVLRMKFKRFVSTFIQMPCQIIRTGRRIIYRLLSWNAWQPVFFRTFDVLRT